jgi:hypothetical protein
MDAKEAELLATSRVPANSGHALHKGTPRETFIRKFLESHLPEAVAVGTGEIIDASSKPNASRNQYDIVLYRRSYPKLDFGGGITAFLVESVIATVEVKSTLTREEAKKACRAAIAAKKFTPNVVSAFYSGYIPPSVLNYVVAYDGPATMDTVLDWLPGIQVELGIVPVDLPVREARIATPSQSVDGIFILGKGFIYFDNAPSGFATDEVRLAQPGLRWVVADTPSGSLLLFFLFLTSATANIEGKWLNAIPYLSSFQVPKVRFGEA